MLCIPESFFRIDRRKLAAVANIHYRDLYFEALEELCTILKEKRYFETIYQLTTTAAGMYPFEEWQLWRIDSLIAMNRYQDAMAIYKEATKHFFDDLDFRLPRRCWSASGS